jgi:hypothetical protein
MQRFSIFLALFGSLLLFGKNAHAEHATVVGVTISCVCEDPMGKAYFGAIKDILAKDPHFTQVSLQEGARRGAIRVNIISMPLDSQDGTPRSALSVVLTHDGTLMHQFIETCTHIPIFDCAQSMVRDLREL